MSQNPNLEKKNHGDTIQFLLIPEKVVTMKIPLISLVALI